jgi:lysophospholipase L1-like esterase
VVERRDLTAKQRRWRRAGTTTGRSRTIRRLRATHRYALRVRHRAAGGRTLSYSRAVIVRPKGRTPATVTGVRAAADGDRVVLSWNAAAGATGYRLERVDVVSGAVERLASGAATGRTDAPPASLAGHWLDYRVVATDGTAAAAPSAPVQVRAAGLASYAAYYALGDSYAAGTGLGQPYDDQQCSRSNRMWGALIPRSLVPPPVLIACSGAKTKDVRLSGAGGGTPQYPDLGGTQLDRVRRAVSATPGPTLITLSIGGNDALFVPQFTRCVVGDCTGDRDTETALIRGPVRRSLDATFTQIRQVAPGADVLVAGYPRLFDEGALPRDAVFAATLTQDERRLANVWATQVDEEVRAAAEAHGLHPVTDEVLKAFEDHGAGGPSPWINPVILADPGTPAGTAPETPATASIHPTAEGNQAYADAVTGALRAYASRVRVR